MTPAPAMAVTVDPRARSSCPATRAWRARFAENRERSFDVRVMAATNRDLALDVKEERFRTDLFYRLNVVELVVPP